ncbi:MAG: hypothetical protein M1825_006169 [Sarcosagium campestre]|nr:MAG: hypothetical protein M1825_006169 [Sarcosagium campestre]
MTATEAWTKTREADQAKDADEFRNFVRVYCKTSPDVTFVDLEKVLRKEKLNFHLIAVEKEIADTQTIVNLQGKTGCKYQAQFHLDPRPKRKKLALGWPDNAEQNLERLKDAGFVEDAFKVKCDNCGAIGHTAKFCKEERKSIEHIIVKCANCDETGHRVRDCTKARVSKSNCRNCHQPGHRANECTEPRSAEGVECKRCGQTGHFAKDCSDSSGGDRSCRNCGKEGHMAKECEEPRNPATVTCRNCDETGHFSKDCSKPRDYSRVKCNNCGEMGHTIVRCKKPALDQDAGGFNQASTENIGDDDGVDAGDVGGW